MAGEKGEGNKGDKDQIYRQALKEGEKAEGEGNGNNSNTTIIIEQPSLGKVETEFDKKQILGKENAEAASKLGYRKLPVESLPSRGMFNLPDMKISIRAATMEEIKHYSSLDEVDLTDVSDHINDLLKNNCKITYTDWTGSYLDLKEADKYFILFSIRDLTMEIEQRQNKLYQPTQCPKCGKKSQNEITMAAFTNYTIPEELMRYYDPKKRKLVINDEENFESPLEIGVPGIGLTIALQKFMQNLAQRQQQTGSRVFFDMKFMLKLQFLLDDATQVTDNYLEGFRKEIGKWTVDKQIAFDYVRENMEVGVTPQIKVVCRETKGLEDNQEVECRDEYSFTAPVQFQQGWRSIFDLSGVITRLFKTNPK